MGCVLESLNGEQSDAVERNTFWERDAHATGLSLAVVDWRGGAQDDGWAEGSGG